ncbi:MAG: purine-binding chemotaxis protein CheW, partial [Desulfobulbaceae bacterium]|nr:purine-binding chemotaxis protein CheW [Desulfobulbaceae bacterium]
MTQSVSRKDGILLETGTNELEIITFSLQWIDPDTQEMQRASYGINAAKVRELVAVPEEITAIADSPDCVMGVFLLRDRTIPLIDLSNWFRYEPDTSPETVRKWTVIVAEMNGKPFGFITHGVDKVYRVSWDQIKLPPEAIANCQTLTGMCLVDDQLIQMVDFERIIAAIDPTMNIHAGEERGSLALSPEFSSKKVFVADDSRTILLQLQSTIEQSGLNV